MSSWDSGGVAEPGDVLENPVTGEQVRFRRTAAETEGESLEYELRFRPQGFVVREHLHPRQDERHEVLSYRLGLSTEVGERVLEPGDAVVVPAGLRTASFPWATVRCTVSSSCGRRCARRRLIAREFEQEGYATRPPLAVQRALSTPLAALARLLGYRAP